jgi:hypothetical protein
MGKQQKVRPGDYNIVKMNMQLNNCKKSFRIIFSADANRFGPMAMPRQAIGSSM